MSMRRQVKTRSSRCSTSCRPRPPFAATACPSSRPGDEPAAAVRGSRLPELAPVPAPPLHRVRRLSYSALALFERCSYRYYAERLAGLRERRPQRDAGAGGNGLAATEVGDAVHRLLELPAVDLELVREWYP